MVKKKNMQPTCLPLLRSNFEDLTRAEQKIANYILENAANVMHMTIAELAENTTSAEATIFRFCHKLGFAGFQGLKLALAGDLYSPMESFSRDIDPADSPQVITQKIFHNISEALQDTLKIMNYAELEKAITALARARKLDAYGFGGSGVIAADVYHRFMRFGLQVNAFSDPHLQAASAALLTKDDVVIAISHTGASIEMLAALEIAKNNKATIIAITSYEKSPITKYADICLIGIAKEIRYRSEATASRFMHLAILDVLYTGLMLRKMDNYIDNMAKIRQAISKHKL